VVVGELVASSFMSSGSDIDLSVAWGLGGVRLTVRDHGRDLTQRQSHPDQYRRALPVVAGLSRAFGVLPTADGGNAAWAVLNVRPSRLSTGPQRSVAGTPDPKTPVIDRPRSLIG
jgi:hypothetical protein